MASLNFIEFVGTNSNIQWKIPTWEVSRELILVCNLVGKSLGHSETRSGAPGACLHRFETPSGCKLQALRLEGRSGWSMLQLLLERVSEWSLSMVWIMIFCQRQLKTWSNQNLDHFSWIEPKNKGGNDMCVSNLNALLLQLYVYCDILRQCQDLLRSSTEGTF
jgi:hypothetical protein